MVLSEMLNSNIDINKIDATNARDLFYYSYLFDVDVTEKILATKNNRYIRLYINHAKQIDKSIFLNYVLKSEDAAFVYYLWYDNEEYNMNSKYTYLFTKKLIELKSERYVGLLLYNYFVVKKLNDECMINIASSIMKCDKKDIINTLEKLLKKEKDSYEINYDKYTKNCYKGHNNLIPFIIVMHISNVYERIIDTFYNDKSEVSSHFVVARSGEYKQVVDLNDSAWANGTSMNESSDIYYLLAKNKFAKSIKENCNYYSFSIEHESFDGSLTEKQYKTSLMIVKKIIKYLKDTYDYDFIIDREHIVGHNEINPVVRTMCPGKKFPFNRFINDLIKDK